MAAGLLRTIQILAPTGEFNDAFLVHQRVTATLQTLKYYRALLDDGPGADAAVPQFPVRLTSFWANSRSAENLRQQMRFAGLRSYRNTPGLVLYERGLRAGGGELAAIDDFDIVHNPGRVAGPDASSTSLARMYEGIFETTVERLVVAFETEAIDTAQGGISSRVPRRILNTHRVFSAAAAAQISPVVLDGGDSSLARLAQLDMPEQAKANIAGDLANGYVVVVPERSVEVDGSPQAGWWRVSARDGTTLGVMTGGRGQANEEFFPLFIPMILAGNAITFFWIGLADAPLRAAVGAPIERFFGGWRPDRRGWWRRRCWRWRSRWRGRRPQMVLTKQHSSFDGALALGATATLILSISTFAQQTTDTAAEFVDLAAYDDRVNVLDASDGARVVTVSSGGRGADRLLDGALEDGWKAAENFYLGDPPVLVLELGQETEIGEVLVYPWHWQRGRIPGAIEVAVSSQSAEAGFNSAGVFALENSQALQALRFEGRRARFIRLTILGVHRDGKPVLGEVMAYAPAIVPEPVRRNLAAATMGGRVESVTSNPENAAALIDGRAETEWWALEPALPQGIVLSFFDGRAAFVDAVSVHPDPEFNVTYPRDFEIWVSEPSQGAGFRLVGQFALAADTVAQEFGFEPIRAQQVRLRFTSAFAEGRIGVAEIAVFEAIAPGIEPIHTGALAELVGELADEIWAANLAAAGNGGLIVGPPTNPENSRWLTADCATPQSFTVAFFNDRPAWISDVYVRPLPSLYFTYPLEAELWVYPPPMPSRNG